ncbi:hypothetical protein MSHOH_3243 [Methanosarcina horonobensis HB-1 = JCM 15518]|uniref:Dystroglycan-type cadherin-like domain-containing protein n=1 Tax=Methanosarcina horonobensis HB-1 = JCM 15518 TaxID=1434110 RepID=A0A0E3SFA0_9EURY|nr:disaggregatase related repeat-containing protein [Methanosarcina horonobensis]AKB79726.1 hypothetical protein MSHOH_3243 [Methanosarcina horonobensis HB-1 = JCM 15518]
MLNRKVTIFFLAICLILATIPATSASKAPVVYVAGDGSGDYNCDGKDDHIQINQALKFVAENSAYTTVHLKGPFTYVIDDSLLIGSNTILEGDSNAVVKLTSNAGWARYNGLIEPLSSGVHDITIQGFEIDGNSGSQSVSTGASYYTIMLLDGCYNITVRNMYIHEGTNDGIRVLNSAYTEGRGNINVYNNKIYRCCHNGVYLTKVSNANIYNNTIISRTNDGITITDSNHISIHDNVIDPGTPTGGCGIQIQRTTNSPYMNDIEISYNKISNTNMVGILVHGYNSYTVPTAARDVYVHHNIITKCGKHVNMGSYWGGGIGVEGFHNTLIENNVIDGCYHDGILMKDIYQTSPSYTYNTVIRNNIIINCNTGSADSSAGYGIRIASTKYTATLQYNDVWNNAKGSYSGLSAGSTDIHLDPLFASSTDYHLKSKAGRWNGNSWVTDAVSSPCIDAGFPTSDYSKEPENNGDRINIGAFGNTNYASKSGSGTTTTNHAPKMNSVPAATVEIGKSLSFTVTASDEDGDSLTYSASSLPTGAKFDGNSRLFSWTPSSGQEGTYSVTFEVSDGKLKDSVTTRITAVKSESTMSLNEMHDNRLREASPETVLPSNPYIDVGSLSDVGRYRDVMWFNVSEYAGSEISSATLSLYWYYPEGTSRSQDTIIEIYRPASTWNPNYVSWNKKNNGVAWTNAGGDWYDKNGVSQGSTPYATFTIKGSTLPDNKYYQLNVTDLVKEYTSGKYANTGFFIKARSENNNYIAFYSSEAESENQKPKLNITKKASSVTVPANIVNVTLNSVNDNRLREASPDTVLPSHSYIDVGSINSVGRYRDVMWFNLSEHAGSEISNATLSLFWYYPEGTSRPEDTVIEVYRPASAWNPSYVSWNKKNNGVAWTNAGGDWYDKNGVSQGSTPYATFTIKGSTLPDNKYYELDITDLVKEYTSGKYENTGFLIKARSESNNYIAFYSSEVENENQRPVLNMKLKQ